MMGLNILLSFRRRGRLYHNRAVAETLPLFVVNMRGIRRKICGIVLGGEYQIVTGAGGTPSPRTGFTSLLRA